MFYCYIVEWMRADNIQNIYKSTYKMYFIWCCYSMGMTEISKGRQLQYGITFDKIMGQKLRCLHPFFNLLI